MPIIPPMVKIPIPKHAITEKTMTTTPNILDLLGFASMKRDVKSIMNPDNNERVIAVEISSESGMISIQIISDKNKVSKSSAIRPKITSIIPDDRDNHAGILSRGDFCFVDIDHHLMNGGF